MKLQMSDRFDAARVFAGRVVTGRFAAMPSFVQKLRYTSDCSVEIK